MQSASLNRARIASGRGVRFLESLENWCGLGAPLPRRACVLSSQVGPPLGHRALPVFGLARLMPSWACND
jgi:hypothetical protein